MTTYMYMPIKHHKKNFFLVVNKASSSNKKNTIPKSVTVSLKSSTSELHVWHFF